MAAVARDRLARVLRGDAKPVFSGYEAIHSRDQAQGQPFTLVLTKTNALFTGDQSAREAAENESRMAYEANRIIQDRR